MKNKKILLGLLAVIFTTVSCSDDSSDSTNGSDNLTIQAKANYSGNNGRMDGAVSITEFKINLKEIEFELDDELVI